MVRCSHSYSICFFSPKNIQKDFWVQASQSLLPGNSRHYTILRFNVIDSSEIVRARYDWQFPQILANCCFILVELWARSIRPKFPKIPVQNRTEQKIIGKSFRKFRSTSRDCPFSRKFGNSGNFPFHLTLLPGMTRP